MHKKLVIVFLLFLHTSFANAEKVSWEDYIKESLKDDYFRDLIYQFRKTDSYQELKNAVNIERKYIEQEMMAHYKSGDPFALFLVAGYFEKNGNTHEYLDALEQLYGYGTSYAQLILGQRMLGAFEGQELSALEGGYHLFYKTRHVDSDVYEFAPERYKELVDRFSYEELDNNMAEIADRIAILEAATGAFEFRYSVPPVEVQMREDNPTVFTITKRGQKETVSK